MEQFERRNLQPDDQHLSQKEFRPPTEEAPAVFRSVSQVPWSMAEEIPELQVLPLAAVECAGKDMCAPVIFRKCRAYS